MATCSEVKERFDMLTHDDIPFDARWEKMKPTINKLLKQINVSRYFLLIQVNYNIIMMAYLGENGSSYFGMLMLLQFGTKMDVFTYRMLFKT